MKITLCAHTESQFSTEKACMEVPDHLIRCFQPIESHDEPIMAFAGGGIVHNSEVMRTALKTREDAAKIIANELAAMIVDQMKKKDTHNGYKSGE